MCIFTHVSHKKSHVKHMFNMCGFKHVFNTCGHFSCVYILKNVQKNLKTK